MGFFSELKAAGNNEADGDNTISAEELGLNLDMGMPGEGSVEVPVGDMASFGEEAAMTGGVPVDENAGAYSIGIDELDSLLDNIDSGSIENMGLQDGASFADSVPIGDINAMMEAAGEAPIDGGMDFAGAEMPNLGDVSAMGSAIDSNAVADELLAQTQLESMVEGAQAIAAAQMPEAFAGMENAEAFAAAGGEMPGFDGMAAGMDIPLESADLGMEMPVMDNAGFADAASIDSAAGMSLGADDIDTDSLLGLSDMEMPVAEAPAVQPVVQMETVSQPSGMMDMFEGGNSMPTDETAIITLGMNIEGNITSEGSLELMGTITGNIAIRGKLNVTGTINGNSKATEIFADNAKVSGDLVSDGPVKLGQGTVVIGNVRANSAVIAGAVKGDIDVHGPVLLDSTAIVMGNIKSKSVQINNGAVIEGNCSQCYAEVNPTSFFDDLKKGAKK